MSSPQVRHGDERVSLQPYKFPSNIAMEEMAVSKMNPDWLVSPSTSSRASEAVLFGWGDDRAGEVEEVLVDLPQGVDFLLQFCHLNFQLLLVAHQILWRENKP